MAILPARQQPRLLISPRHAAPDADIAPGRVIPSPCDAQSWRRLNPGWEIRFYDDEACLEFVSREFPEYLAAYRALPKHVERSDFFRYMVCF